MPLAKIYVNEGQYDEARLTKISEAVQAALRGTLGVPPDDFFQLIFEMPPNRYLHTASFVGMEYTDDLVTLEILFVSGRSRETRLALLKDLDTRIAAAAGISPDDVFINSNVNSRIVRGWGGHKKSVGDDGVRTPPRKISAQFR